MNVIGLVLVFHSNRQFMHFMEIAQSGLDCLQKRFRGKKGNRTTITIHKRVTIYNPIFYVVLIELFIYSRNF